MLALLASKIRNAMKVIKPNVLVLGHLCTLLGKEIEA